jgi:hypothetical protein
MRIGSFTEARHSLVEKYHKFFRHRGVVIALWCQLALIIGMVCLYVVIRFALPWSFHDNDTTFRHKEIIAAVVGMISIVGLPILALILGVRGVLPGTWRKHD